MEKQEFITWFTKLQCLYKETSTPQVQLINQYWECLKGYTLGELASGREWLLDNKASNFLPAPGQIIHAIKKNPGVKTEGVQYTDEQIQRMYDNQKDTDIESQLAQVQAHLGYLSNVMARRTGRRICKQHGFDFPYEIPDSAAGRDALIATLRVCEIDLQEKALEEYNEKIRELM